MEDLDLKNSRRIVKIRSLPSRPVYASLEQSFSVTVGSAGSSSLGHGFAISLYPVPDHYWTFDDADTSGSVLSDSIGSLDGTIIDNVTTGQSGILSESYLFARGSTNGLELGTDVLAPTGDFSVAFWIQSTLIPSDDVSTVYQKCYIANRDDAAAGTQDGWFIRAGVGDLTARIQFFLEDEGVSDATVSDLYAVRAKKVHDREGWQQIVCTFDSSTGTKKVYTDRVKIHENTTAGLIGANFSNGGTIKTKIGSNQDTHDFEGYMDDMKYWDGVVLSQADVEAIYDEFVDQYTFPTPTGYFSCDSDSISGSTLADQIGSDDGTIVGSVTNPTGLVNEGLYFTTGNDYINLGFGPWDFTGSFSIAFWMQHEPGGGEEERIVQNRGTGGYGTQVGWAIRILTTNQLEFIIDNGSGTSMHTDTSEYTDPNEWQHVIATWDSSTGTKRLYVNGMCIQSETNATLIGLNLTSGRESTIGISKVSTTLVQDYNGYLDEIAWWDGTVLDGENAMKLYQYGRKGLKLDD
jgi:hypothetical protein